MPAASERIDLRASVETKALIARAAATTGMSLSAFLLTAAAERAQAVLRETDSLTLTAQDWQAFVAALDDLDRPRPKLQAAMHAYRTWQSQQQDA